MKKRFALLILLLLAIPACSSNDRWKLHGRWQSKETTPVCGMRFDASGLVTLTLPSGEEIPGHYTLLAGDYVDFELSQQFNGSNKHREKITLTGSVLTLHDSDGTVLRFQRDFK